MPPVCSSKGMSSRVRRRAWARIAQGAGRSARDPVRRPARRRSARRRRRCASRRGSPPCCAHTDPRRRVLRGGRRRRRPGDRRARVDHRPPRRHKGVRQWHRRLGRARGPDPERQGHRAAVSLPATGELFRADTVAETDGPLTRRLVTLAGAARTRRVSWPTASVCRWCRWVRPERRRWPSSGRRDAYVAGGQYEWDNAAPVGVALAAGLHCSRLDGSEIVYNNRHPTSPTS